MPASPPSSLDAAARALVLRHVRTLISTTLDYLAQHEDEQLKRLRSHLYEQVDARPHTTQAQNLRAAAMLLDQQGARFHQALQATVREVIEEDLDGVLPGALAALRPAAAEPESESPISMALLDVDEIERHLLVDRVSQRFNQHYDARLKPLTQSLGALFRLEEFALGDNPFRPAALVRAMSLAWQRCEFDPAAAEDFVSVLEPRMLTDWAPLYDSLTQLLVRAGFTAHTVHRIKRAPGHESGHAPLQGLRDAADEARSGHGALEPAPARSGFAPLGGPAGGAGGSAMAASFGRSGPGPIGGAEGELPPGHGGAPGAAQGGGGIAGGSSGLAARARQFLQMLGIGGTGRGGGAGEGGDTLGGDEDADFSSTLTAHAPADATLMGFLGGLQATARSGPVSSQFPTWLAGQDIGDQNLLRRMHEREEVRNAPEIDRGTIDALAEVFDYVFADRAIPMQLKIVIGRLQIPVLKAAMLDRDFFLSPAHPARRLVDALASASVAWMPEQGEDDPLYVRIDATVRRVLAEFDNDLALFSQLLEDFNGWMEENARLAEDQLEPAVDEERSGEAHTLALAHVDEVVHQCIHALPADEALQPFLLPFLTTQWREVLARAWLAREAAPADWDAAVRTMDELVWSTRPKPQPEERSRLMALLPDLVTRLNASMDALGWQGEDRAEFTRRLIATHMKAIRGSKAAAVSAAATPDSGPGELEAAAGRDALKALDARRAAPPALAGGVDDFDAVAQGLARGQWVDLEDAEGALRRYRLGWVSPQRTRLLFTNRDGYEAIVHSEREVATLLRQGRLHLLDDQPIVGRALDRLMAGGTAEAAAPDLALR